jgi:hypothetical protein
LKSCNLLKSKTILKILTKKENLKNRKHKIRKRKKKSGKEEKRKNEIQNTHRKPVSASRTRNERPRKNESD